MMYSSHKLVGLAASIEVSNLLINSTIGFNPYRDFVTLAVGSMIGAALPDFDTSDSTISHKLGILHFPVRIIQGITRILSRMPGPLQKAFKELNMLCGHRGVLHTLLLQGVLGVPPLISVVATIGLNNTMNITVTFLLGLVIGSLTHLLTDTIFGGTRLLYPFYKKKIKLSPFTTGGLVEQMVRVILTIDVILRLQEYISCLL